MMCVPFAISHPKSPFIRMRPSVALMLGALTLGLLVHVGSVSALETFRALQPAEQRLAPVFALPDQYGTPIGSTDLQEKVVVVRFWVTW